MARGRTDEKPAPAKGNHIVLDQIAVGTFGPARCRQHDLAAGPPLEQPSASHVIGVNMSFQRREEPEAKLVDQGRIAPHLLEHGIDQDRLAIVAVAKQIRCRSTIADRTVAERSRFAPWCAHHGKITLGPTGGAPIARRRKALPP